MRRRRRDFSSQFSSVAAENPTFVKFRPSPWLGRWYCSGFSYPNQDRPYRSMPGIVHGGIQLSFNASIIMFPLGSNRLQKPALDNSPPADQGQTRAAWSHNSGTSCLVCRGSRCPHFPRLPRCCPAPKMPVAINLMYPYVVLLLKRQLGKRIGEPNFADDIP